MEQAVFSLQQIPALNKLQNYSILLLILFLTGCSEYNRVRKKGSFEEKYELAVKYYDMQEYFKSSILFEEIMVVTRGRKEAEDVNYYYGMTQFYQKQYIVSSYHFERIYTTFPRSKYAEESRLMYAHSLYMLTPNYYLDQSYTNDAIAAYQDYINKYPDTDQLKECNSKIDELRYKLEQKDFDNAKLLYKIREYKASVVALDNFVNDFPGSFFTEEALFTKLKAQYDLANNSLKIVIDDNEIVYLKRDRFREVVYFYLDFIDKHPNSEFAKEAERLYSSAKNNLKVLETES